MNKTKEMDKAIAEARGALHQAEQALAAVSSRVYPEWVQSEWVDAALEGISTALADLCMIDCDGHELEALEEELD